MEFLTPSLNEVINKLSPDQQEEINVIESITNITENNKETVCQIVSKYVKRLSFDDCFVFVFCYIDNVSMIRTKERESIVFLINWLIEEFKIELQKFEIFPSLKEMLHMKNIIPESDFLNEHIFDFAEDGTIERAIFEDDVNKVRQLMAIQTEDSEEEEEFDILSFIPDIIGVSRSEANRLELSALFGSVKCFKYFVSNGEKITKDVCKFAVASGENQIIHICEQNGQKFEDCLHISALYHHYDIFEWLNMHFEYEKLSVLNYIEYYNEPLIYLSIYNGYDIKLCGNIVTDGTAKYGLFEIFKYINEHNNDDVEVNDFLMESALIVASLNGHLGIIKYIYEHYEVNIDKRDRGGYTPLENAIVNGHIEVVKYLCEHCHANIETKNDSGYTSINCASYQGKFEIVKYLYEVCHANIETRDNYGYTPLNNASSYGYINIVKYLCEVCHANINTKDKWNNDPISNADLNKNPEIVNYLKSQVR